MKVKKFSVSASESGSCDLPTQFNEAFRPDLVKRAVLAVQANKRQNYGQDPESGMKHSPELSRRRRAYRGGYGPGQSRVPRKIHSRNGTRMSWVAAGVPNVVGGRPGHAPQVEKDWSQKINKKERRKALRSAIAATVNKELVAARGHKVPDKFPFVLEAKLEDLKTTKEVSQALVKLGFEAELDRVSERKVRAGLGKMRNRRYRTKTGPLLVVSKPCALSKGARNLRGVDVVIVDKLNAEQLAPGAVAGRLTVWTEDALKRMQEEKLFS